MTIKWVLILFAAVPTLQLENFVKIGDLRTLYYEVAGHVFVANQTTLLIRNFNYTGAAPDALFLVGTTGMPDKIQEETTAILAHPFTGKHFEYKDTDYPVLKKYVDEDVSLTLPPHLTVSDLRWLSVWCKAYEINFGDVVFLHDLLLKKDSEVSKNMSVEVVIDVGIKDDTEDIANEKPSQLDDPEDPEETSIVMNIISSVQGAIGALQSYLDFLKK